MDQAGPHETVAIGLNEKGKRDAVPKAKVRNFKPRLIGNRLELSSFCIDELSDLDIWVLLDQHLDKPAIGRADLGTVVFADVGLNHVPDWDPERHINILGWPADEEVQASIAQSLYNKQVYNNR